MKSVKQQVFGQVEGALRSQIPPQLHFRVDRQVWNQVYLQVWEQEYMIRKNNIGEDVKDLL
jgi:hypothetical protein